MKKFSKLFALVLTIFVLTLAVACKSDKTGKDHWDAIIKNGKIVIGYTVFAPIAYPDENGNLIGFDIELPKEVAKYYGIEAEFQEIDWDTKEAELASSNIDLIWNGLTITEERQENLSLTIPYMKNQQVVLIRKENAPAEEAPAEEEVPAEEAEPEGAPAEEEEGNPKKPIYTSIESLKNATVAAEAGSAGEEAIKDNHIGKSYIGLPAQVDILNELHSRTIDAGVMDSVMANYYLSLEVNKDLAIVSSISFAEEYYGIAARKDSPYVAAMISNAIIALAKDGKVARIAMDYGLTDVVSIDTTQTVPLP